LANVVLVPKKNEKMRMCIDFTDLNKACKKDPFPLPRIDTSIDKIARCKSSPYWIVSQDIIKFGSTKKMRKRQVSLPPSELTTTLECPKH